MNYWADSLIIDFRRVDFSTGKFELIIFNWSNDFNASSKPMFFSEEKK